ncbi:MAG: tripartite tricarboxylate transporter substrate binding protein [Alphaproteobacteria bacterium]|nr:tripartite tricarboxylate transporter substrate binding protein [Alphaproteobacteria bacterium]
MTLAPKPGRLVAACALLGSATRALAAGALAASAFAGAAMAQGPAFPSKRITLIVPAVAGGASDIVARIVAQPLGAALGQGVIIENRSGASGNVAGTAVARAEPDGHTLLMAATNNIVINQFTMKNPGHDPLTDFVPVALVAEAPELIAISANFPAKTLKEFIDALRAKPGGFNYGSPGVGSVPHLSTERFLRATGTRMTHVPFRGSAAAMADVATGAIQMSMASLGSVEPFRQAATARILAVTAPKRMAALPDVPTLEEVGWPNLEMSNWWGVVAPRGTPREIVETLNRHLRAIFTDKATVARLAQLGIVAHSESVAFFEQFIQKEAKAWHAVVKDLGLEAK